MSVRPLWDSIWRRLLRIRKICLAGILVRPPCYIAIKEHLCKRKSKGCRPRSDMPERQSAEQVWNFRVWNHRGGNSEP